MEFVAPNFLWALGLIAIPIIIHLFNFRKYKTIYFSDIRFLKEVKEETRKRSTLKHLLILISRILAIVFLVFAFAQPFIPNPSQHVGKTDQIVSIYLDNSFSMDATGEDGTYYEMGRQMAVELVEHYGADVKFQLITNNSASTSARLQNKEAMLASLDELEISNQSRTIPEILKLQAETERQNPKHATKSYIISDFQTKMLAASDMKDSISYLSTIVINAKNQYNLSIDSVWFETPVRKLDALEVLKIQVRNHGDSTRTTRIDTEIGGSSSGTQLIIPGDTSAIGEIRFTNKNAGHVGAKVYLSDAEQMHYDDTLYFSYQVLNQINVLEVYEGERASLSKIFGNDSLFNYQSSESKQFQPSSTDGINFLVINDVKSISSGMKTSIENFIQLGGSVMLFPAMDADLSSYNSLISSLNAGIYQNLYVGSVGTKPLDRNNAFISDVFEKFKSDVDLPNTLVHYSITSPIQSEGTQLYELFSGDPLMSRFKYGAGNLYTSAVGLDPSFGNFSKHWLFVTTVVRAAQLSYPKNDLFYTIGGQRQASIVDKGYNTEVNFILSKGKTSFIPLVDRSSNGKIDILSNVGTDNSSILDSDGIYSLSHDGELICKLAFNHGRDESALEFTNNLEELESYLVKFDIRSLNIQQASAINDLIDSIQELKPRTFWKTCLILALIFLAIEIALIKLWKN